MTLEDIIEKLKSTDVNFKDMDTKQRAAKLFSYRIGGKMLKKHLADIAGEELVPGKDMGDGTFNAYCALIEELLAEDL